ncbi:MAG: aryl-sulfate sulfotransferase, partial [Bacteroidia bacterium]|nr:aryl-sulfate sulfotransferase [Bacteroidia bacterium]
HQWDHLVQDHDSTKNNFGVVSEHPELLNINYKPPAGRPDWQHFNSVFYNEERDEIVLSSRNMNEIYIIDHSTTTSETAGHTGGDKGKGGDFLYRWGNPEVYNRGTSASRKLYGQHDARVIPGEYPDEGSMTIFNNGAGRPGGNYSSIDLIIPPLDEDGHYIIPDSMPLGPDFIHWQYISPEPDDFYSNNMGGAQRLANGNTIICEANKGNFFEVTRQGEQVWRYRNTAGAGGPFTQGQSGGFGFSTSVFKVLRYAPDFPGFDGKDLSPGNPIELDPIDYDCEIPGSNTTSLVNEISEESDFEWLLENGQILIPNNGSDHILVRVLSLNGQVIVSRKTRKQEEKITLGELPQGIYFINIIDLEKQVQKSWKFSKLF